MKLSCFMSKDDLELLLFLSLPPEHCELGLQGTRPCLVYAVLGIEPRAHEHQGNHSAT